MGYVEEHLPSKCEAPSSNIVLPKQTKKPQILTRAWNNWISVWVEQKGPSHWFYVSQLVYCSSELHSQVDPES
jgi:hypothetical protein